MDNIQCHDAFTIFFAFAFAHFQYDRLLLNS